MNSERCLQIGLKVVWDNEGKKFETYTNYDLDVAKVGEIR